MFFDGEVTFGWVYVVSDPRLEVKDFFVGKGGSFDFEDV